MSIFSDGPALSIGPFQKIYGEAIYFPYVVRKNEEPTDFVQKL